MAFSSALVVPCGLWTAFEKFRTDGFGSGGDSSTNQEPGCIPYPLYNYSLVNTCPLSCDNGDPIQRYFGEFSHTYRAVLILINWNLAVNFCCDFFQLMLDVFSAFDQLNSAQRIGDSI